MKGLAIRWERSRPSRTDSRAPEGPPALFLRGETSSVQRQLVLEVERSYLYCNVAGTHWQTRDGLFLVGQDNRPTADSGPKQILQILGAGGAHEGSRVQTLTPQIRVQGSMELCLLRFPFRQTC